MYIATTHFCSVLTPSPLTSPSLSSLTQVSLDVIELDPEILTVAEKWFGFVQGEGVRVCVGDGVEAIRQKCAAGEKGECWFSGVHETITEP